MKKLFLLAVSSTVVCLAHAQTAQPFILKKFMPKTFNFSSEKVLLSSDTLPLPQTPQPLDNMPVTNSQPVQLTFVGNNGHGLDIYKAQQDNMPVVMPDKTYVNTMPTGRYKMQQSKIVPRYRRYN